MRAAIICFMAFSMLILADPSAGQFIPHRYSTGVDPMEQFACEILLNPDKITYDLSPLEELLGSGSVYYIEVGEPTIHVATEEGVLDIEEESRYPPGEYYIISSYIEDEIAVVITETDDTAFVNQIYPGTDADGLSISFVVPASLQDVERSMVRSEVEVFEDMELNSTLTFLAEEMGYQTFPLRDPLNEPAGYTLQKENLTIHIFNKVPRDLETELRSGFIASAGSLREVPDLRSELVQLLSHAGANSTYAENASFNEAIEIVQELMPDIQKDIDEIVWQDLVGSELKRLREMGVIEGLTDSDIEAISGLAGPGVSGIQHRIMEFNEEWIRTDDELFLPYLGGQVPEDGSRSRFNFDIDDLPLPLPEIVKEEVPDLVPQIVFISLTTVYLTGISIVFFARHNRDELLDNMNRKALFDAIKDNPGIHYKALQRKLDLKQGVLSYHLNKLEKNEIIKSVQDGNKRRFYLYEDRIEFQFRLHEVQESILQLICRKPGLSQTKISKSLGRNKMVVNYHLRILSDAGIVSFEKEGREYQYFGTPAAENLLSSA